MAAPIACKDIFKILSGNTSKLVGKNSLRLNLLFSIYSIVYSTLKFLASISALTESVSEIIRR